MKRSGFTIFPAGIVLFYLFAASVSAQILLNEVSVNPSGTDGPCEYFELRGTPGSPVENIHFVSLEGDSGSTPGVATGVLTFGSPGPVIGANGLLVVVGTLPCGARTYPPSTTVITTSFLDTGAGALQNGTNSFLLISSVTAITPGTDYDTDNNGTLESLPAGATVIDGVAWSDGGAGDITYGSVTLSSTGGVTGAATRFRNDLTPNSFAAWYNGALVDDGAGNASVAYSATVRSTNFPIGGMLTPGSVNAPVPVTKVFTAYLNGANEVPANGSSARGFGRVILNDAETQITASVYYNNLGSGVTMAHIHGPAAPGANANVLFDMAPAPLGQTSGSAQDRTFAVTAQQVADLKAGLWYFNVHSTNIGSGEIRGQLIPARTANDFEGDSRTDYVVLRDSNGAAAGGFVEWYIQSSSNAAMQMTTWGIYDKQTEDLAAADYDGDGKTDIAVWRRTVPFATFHIILSSNFTLVSDQLGFPTDDPDPADYNGDGKADVAVRRDEGNGFTGWYYRPSFGANYVALSLNASGAEAGGDYDGDGIYDPAKFEDTVVTPRFVILLSGGGTSTVNMGAVGDLVAPGDYDGDGKTDPAVIRNVGGFWQWTYRPSSGGPDVVDNWGIAPTDMPTPGDYNGDGKWDYAIWRDGAQGEFFIMTPITRFIFTRQWGLAGDFPLGFGTHVSNE